MPAPWKMLITGITGRFRVRSSCINSVSGASISATVAPSLFRIASAGHFMTSSTISARSNACMVFDTRSWPIPPASSSKPAVSMNRHGPMPGISMAFRTGSVVVPGTSDTTDVSCPVMALTRLDFPLFLFPMTAICSLSEDGVSCIPPAVCLPASWYVRDLSALYVGMLNVLLPVRT